MYFALMRAGTFALGKAIALAYDRTATLAFTTHGRQQLRTRRRHRHLRRHLRPSPLRPRRPLIEVPVLAGLVYAPALLTGGLLHQLTTVRTEDFDEDAATVAFHDPARYADGCATHPIPAWAHLFLRAAACFATLTDGFWPAKATGLSRYASPRAPNLPPPQPLAPQQTEPGRVVWDWKERKKPNVRATDCPSPQTGILVRRGARAETRDGGFPAADRQPVEMSANWTMNSTSNTWAHRHSSPCSLRGGAGGRRNSDGGKGR